ncbi:MAG: DUF2500 domain-containing protein [Lachnospiraceae bacterium]|nr:DUF2500 domain-containing protein [uncultured Acetatifactor sp.]MCI9218577.1 DUF2500 domain-containing protein [Lachnospiraceae bacterium]
MGFFFNSGFFEICFMTVFLLVIAVFVVNAVRAVTQWNKNNHSPVLTVDAKVVSRRTSVRTHHHGGDAAGTGGYHTSSSTSYYVTFEVESGDRMEFHLTGSEYGMLAEGDMGKLRFQGTRYLGFERRHG